MSLSKSLVIFLVICGIREGTLSAEDLKARADINRIEKYPTTNAIKMRIDTDGIIEKDEYRIISENGRLTRRPCPYTCEMRGIPKKYCHEFHSIDGSECYIEDTRLPDDALPK